MRLPTDERRAAAAVGAAPTVRLVGWRTAVAAVGAVTFVASWWVTGPPVNRLDQFLWILLIVLTAGVGRGRPVWRILLDWLPLFAILFAYDWTRGFATDLNIPVHYRWPIEADRFLFGGVVPTQWLQAHFYTPDVVHWYDALAGLIYLSHFFASLALATVLYLRSRPVWAAYMRRFIALSLAGLVTYALYPAAPPWLASRHGMLPDVSQITHRGLTAWGMAPTAHLLRKGAAHANQVAAVPSLHAGFSMFVALFLIRMGRRPARRLWLLAYPLAMGLSVVYTGEHYVVDVLIGWLYALGVMAGVAALERRYLGSARLDDPDFDVDVRLEPAQELAGLARRSSEAGPRNTDVGLKA